MRHLKVFNSVRVMDGDGVSKRDLETLRYAGFLTLSQSGDAKNLISGIITASKLGVSCINVVNVEDSPITRVIQETVINDEGMGPRELTLTRSDSSSNIVSAASLQRTGMPMSNATFYENDENIGFYMKSGFCYSDVKCFIPQILAMALVSIWFSDKKTTVLDREIKQRRKALIRDIEMLPERINKTLTDDYLAIYKQVAEVLKTK